MHYSTWNVATHVLSLDQITEFKCLATNITVIGACKAEFTHNMEVGSKLQKKLNMVLR
jgi:hypothetical protein